MTSQNKKWAALGAVVLVMGIAAVIFLQQTKTRVEADVRAALSALPNVTQSSVEKIDFDFFGQSLTLKNLHLTFTEAGSTADVTINEVMLIKPNAKALQGDISAGTLLAEEIRVTHYTATTKITTPPAQVQSRAESVRITQLHADTAGIMNLTLVNGVPRDAAKGFKALESLKAASAHYAGLSVNVTSPELPVVHMSLDSLDARDLTHTYTGSATLKNWKIDIKGMGYAALSAVELAALTLPDISKFPPELLKESPTDADIDAITKAFMTTMPKDKPMLGSLILRDFTESMSGNNVAFKRLTFDNCWYEPAQGGFQVEELSMPANIIPSPLISMLGYTHLMVSGDAALRPLAASPAHTSLKEKLVRLTTSLAVQDAGNIQLTMDMEDPLTTGTTAQPALPVLNNIDDLLLANFKLTYADKGLAARGARLSQALLNIGPSMIIAMAKDNATNIVGNKPEDIQQFMNFVEKPGELTISVTPTKPIRIGQVERLFNSDALRVTSVPGPKTLQELAKP